jgi:hypothetical protein
MQLLTEIIAHGCVSMAHTGQLSSQPGEETNPCLALTWNGQGGLEQQWIECSSVVPACPKKKGKQRGPDSELCNKKSDWRKSNYKALRKMKGSGTYSRKRKAKWLTSCKTKSPEISNSPPHLGSDMGIHAPSNSLTATELAGKEHL